MGLTRTPARSVGVEELEHRGQHLEEAPPDRIFSDPSQAGTRQFLDRVIAAGRL